MSELSKTSVNHSSIINDVNSTKKRALEYDTVKENDKKIKLEQNKYHLKRINKTKNELKSGNSAAVLFKRLFFGNKEILQENNIKTESEDLENIDIEKEKYENEIIELRKQCQAYENQIKNLSSINKLLTDKNIELLNANKKFEFLIKEKNNDDINDSSIVKNILENDDIKSKRNEQDIETIKKQNSIIKSLNETIKYYQITVDKQKNELEFYKLNCTCKANNKKRIDNTEEEEKYVKPLCSNIKSNLNVEQQKSHLITKIIIQEDLKENSNRENKGEKESLMSNTYCNTNTNESELINFINNEQFDNGNSNTLKGKDSLSPINEQNIFVEKVDDNVENIVNNEETNNSNKINNNNKEDEIKNEKIDKENNHSIENDNCKKIDEESNINVANINQNNNLIKKLDKIINDKEHSESLLLKNVKEFNKSNLTPEKYNDIGSTCKILETMVEQKQNQIDEYESQLNESKECINKQLEIIRQLNEKINNQIILLESNKHKIITLETIIKEHGSIIKNSNNEIEKLEDTIDKLEEQKNKDNKIITKSQSLIEHHKAIADSAKTTLEHQTIVIQGLEKQVEKLQQNLLKKDREIEAIKSNSRTFENNIKNLKSSLEEKNLLLKKMENDNQILKNENQVLEIDLKSKQSDNNTNENTIEVMSKNNQELENTLTQYKQDIHRLRQKVIKMKVQISSSDGKSHFSDQNDLTSDIKCNMRSVKSKIKRLLDIFNYDDEKIHKDVIINEIKHFYNEYKLLIKSYINEINDNKYKMELLYSALKETNLLLKDKEDLMKDYDNNIGKYKMSIEKLKQENSQLKGNLTVNEKIASNHLIRIKKLEEIIKMYENMGQKEKEEKGEKDISYYKLELQKVQELYENKNFEALELHKFKNLKQIELENLKVDYFNLENEFNERKHVIEGLEETIAIYEKISSENQNRINELELSNSELLNLISNYEKVHKSSQDTLEGLEQKAIQIQNIINAYEESNEISKEKQSILEKTIQDQTLTIQEHEDTIQSMNILQKQLNNLEKINENQSSTIRSYETMIEDLRESFSSLRRKTDSSSSSFDFNTKSNFSDNYANFNNNSKNYHYSGISDDTLHNININVNNKNSILDKYNKKYNTEDKASSSTISSKSMENKFSIDKNSNKLNENYFKSSYYTPKKSSLSINGISGKLSLNNSTIYKTPINYQKYALNTNQKSNLFNDSFTQTIYKTPYDYNIYRQEGESSSNGNSKRKNIAQLLSEYQERENIILKTPIKKEIDEEKSYLSSSLKSLKSPNIRFSSEKENNITPYNQKYSVKTNKSMLSENMLKNQMYNSSSSIYNNNDNNVDLSSSPSFYTPPSQTKTISTISSVTNKNKNDNNIKLNLTSLSDISPSLKFSKKK